jgi:DNA-binding response OmpR family regulator
MRGQPKPFILIVEDEEELAKLISEQLENAGMQTQICNTCGHAFRFLQKNFVNLALLDVNLPDQTGFSLLEDLRKAEINVPAIFLTGNDSEISKVKGLDLGGDDYLTKPFKASELVARIRAVLRRAEFSRDFNITKNARLTDEPFAFAGATINPTRLEIAFPDGEVIKLGRKEVGILAYLNDHPSVIITRKNLIHSVWGMHADVRSRSLDQYIVKVRGLFEKHGLPLTCLRTIHGIGYQYDPAAVPEPVAVVAAEPVPEAKPEKKPAAKKVRKAAS